LINGTNTIAIAYNGFTGCNFLSVDIVQSVSGTTPSQTNINTCSTCEVLTVGGGILVDASSQNKGTTDKSLKFGACETGEAIG
ncbi:hypothetical protein ACI4AF_29520, partial [Klebsiella pneumoniae]|uniref:hypothetical protein n=1 Tax=Klebsiella pneumoniae TaxID=573 RepID=UPI0038546108